MAITINNQTFDITAEQETKLRDALNLNSKRLSDIKIGETFKIADIEFIKFIDENGITAAVTKNLVFNAKFDNNTNNFAKSSLLNKLKTEVLTKIESAIGSENVIEFETNLISLDGLDDYGYMKSKISLPTFDFYRKYVRIFDRYNVNDWWWLSTPDSTPTHGISSIVRCVYGGGTLYYNCCFHNFGVRPILFFKSSIFVS